MRDSMRKHLDLRTEQLGMNYSTASGRLVKDLLYKFVEKYHPNCYRCNQPLTRETFSIEHKEPWLHSADPVANFFNLENIDFSHLSCNCASKRTPNKIYASDRERDNAKQKRRYTPERRRAKYLRTGN